MLTGQLALLVAVFTGAALHIDVVEQPARLRLEAPSPLTRWNPAYKRGALMQAPPAIFGFLSGLAAWPQSGPLGWAIGAVLMIANRPVTYVAIMPVNNRLMPVEPSTAGVDTRRMGEKWGALHAARTILGRAASPAFLWASLA